MSYEAVAENSRNLGNRYAREGNFGRAFSHYLVALKLNPEWKTQLREEFSSVLCKWGTILDKRMRFNDLFTCYEQAIEVFPDDAVILNNLGSHLLRCGLLKEAAHYFRKCLTVRPYFIRAAHNLENVSNLAVERWHFRMLNDQHRNEAFREAIIKKIRQGFDIVLDVGTGTGLLSLFCSEGKAKEIYACDSSPIMVEMAEQVFRSNNAHDIKLINKHSSKLEIPEDIRGKVSLLVTETFDAGLLGEDILNTLSHAWTYLLLPPHPQAVASNPEQFGVVIPFGASIYVTGLELDEFANDFHLKPNNLFENYNIVRNCEDYDTHNLSRTRYRCLTGTEKIYEINFNDPNALEEISKRISQLTLKCKCSGRLDCFAVWFDLCLDEDIVLSTSPLSKACSAWDQAIFPLPKSAIITEGQHVPVTVSCENKKLNVSAGDTLTDKTKFEASEEVIKVLNNEKLKEVFCQIVSKQSSAFSNAVSILDCCPFPVFGLSFLIKRSDRFRDKLTCFVPTENDRRLVCLIAEKHCLQVDCTVMKETCFEDCGQVKFDIILLDLVEINGEIKDGILLQLEYLKSLLKPDGIILPEEAVVIGQFIYSDWLCQASKVSDDSVTCGYNIAEYINAYQVRHFIDLDLKAVENTACSEPFELFSLLDLSESNIPSTVPRRSAPLYANAMVYWMKMKFAENCCEIVTNCDSSYRQAAVLFSKVELSEEIKFNVIRSNGLFSIELLNS